MPDLHRDHQAVRPDEAQAIARDLLQAMEGVEQRVAASREDRIATALERIASALEAQLAAQEASAAFAQMLMGSPATAPSEPARPFEDYRVIDEDWIDVLVDSAWVRANAAEMAQVQATIERRVTRRRS